jgi:hypothetical protein
MPITRRALLIANPGEVGDEDYCKGVYVDIKNYQQHLISSEGGAWDGGEIQYLNRPSAADVRMWIAEFSRYDYLLVMFTGHCAYSNADRDHVLELRRGERITYAQLIQGAKRRTVILDCCQQVHEESLMEKYARSIMILNASNASRGRTANREACKKLYLEALERCPISIIKMLSCSVGELSTDSDTLGGRYNSSLFDCTSNWIEGELAKPYYSPPAMLSVVGAHECASVATTKKSAGQQNPTIDKPRTGPYFPFAVFA